MSFQERARRALSKRSAKPPDDILSDRSGSERSDRSNYDTEKKEEEFTKFTKTEHTLENNLFEEDEDSDPDMQDAMADRYSKKLTTQIQGQVQEMESLRKQQSGGPAPVDDEPLGSYDGPTREYKKDAKNMDPNDPFTQSKYRSGRQDFPDVGLPDSDDEDEDEKGLSAGVAGLPPMSTGLDDDGGDGLGSATSSSRSNKASGTSAPGGKKPYRSGRQEFPDFDFEDDDEEDGGAPTQKPTRGKAASLSEIIMQQAGGRKVNKSGYRPNRKDFPELPDF